MGIYDCDGIDCWLNGKPISLGTKKYIHLHTIKENYRMKNIHNTVSNLSLAHQSTVPEKTIFIDHTTTSDISDPSKQPLAANATVSKVVKCLHQHHPHLISGLYKSLSNNPTAGHYSIYPPLMSDLSLEVDFLI